MTDMELAKQSAEVTHNHPEGIKGAQATATEIREEALGKLENAMFKIRQKFASRPVD